MSKATTMRAKLAALGVVGAVLIALGAASSAHAAADDPIFVFTPVPIPFAPPEPPPWGYFEGPCGIAVDSAGNFYVADHYHDAVDVFGPSTTYLKTQLTDVDPAGVLPRNGPCGLALDSAGALYVNSYHRFAARFTPSHYPTSRADPASFGPGVAIDSDHPTGVAVDPATDDVYVNTRTAVAAYDSAGAPLEVGGEPLRIGAGSLGEGYGLAVSGFPATAGRLYVADAADDTVKVYDPAVDAADPVATIDGAETPSGSFVSLRDSAVAVDRVSGNVYVADNLQPGVAEEPLARIYVFGPSGAYLGHLKHEVVDALPPGLAVDNSSQATQGRLYVTSGNTEIASVYAYPPGAETNVAAPLAAPSEPAAGAAGLRATSQVFATAGSRGSGGAEASEVSQSRSVRLSVGGQIAPRRLPRAGGAPIAVSIDWRIATTDDSPAPPLKRLRIEINRHGRFDSTGLPTCRYKRIQPASSARALAACRPALVGEGTFTADVGLADQEPYPAHGRLLVFNGRSDGKPVLFGQIYSPRPFATSFVITFELERLGSGAYGTALTASLPPALASWGNLTAVEMRLARNYTHRGRRHSFVSASCPAPPGFAGAVFPLMHASFDFGGGLSLASTVNRGCKAR
jgi:DNA-binding beta-propeller fold protein YncE